jgi:hypothetical protein
MKLNSQVVCSHQIAHGKVLTNFNILNNGNGGQVKRSLKLSGRFSLGAEKILSNAQPN